MSDTTDFSPDFATARQRLLAAAKQRGWDVQSFVRASPDKADLWTDFIRIGATNPLRLFVLSSGLHGVEGCAGSAIQLQLVNNWESDQLHSSDVAVLLIHALNPFGFAHDRRTDQANVDLNRNFLLPGESYAGAHPHYAELDPFLNPSPWPRNEIPFELQALGKAIRYGFRGLELAVTQGQYEFPQGLFYGGSHRRETVEFCEQHVLPELQAADSVLHFDVHTGLGRFGTDLLMLDVPLSAEELQVLQSMTSGRVSQSTNPAHYVARGSLTHWIRHYVPQALSACWEWGTLRPVKVLAALRAENAAHHASDLTIEQQRLVKNRMRHTFCPPSNRWQHKVLTRSGQVLNDVLGDWLLGET